MALVIFLYLCFCHHVGIAERALSTSADVSNLYTPQARTTKAPVKHFKKDYGPAEAMKKVPPPSAHGFADIGDVINERTATYSMRMVICPLTVLTRTIDLALIYDEGINLLLQPDLFGIGKGWGLSLPHFIGSDSDPQINMGDGSSVTLTKDMEESTHSFTHKPRYYLAKDIRVVNYKHQQKTWKVVKHGDEFTFELAKQKMLTRMDTREGYVLYFKNDPQTKQFTISDDKVDIFTMRFGESQVDLRCHTALGLRHYTVFRDNRVVTESDMVTRVKCNTCPDSGELKIEYDRDHLLHGVKRVTQPSGTVDEFDRVIVGAIYQEIVFQISRHRRTTVGGRENLTHETEYAPSAGQTSSHLHQRTFMGKPSHIAASTRTRDGLMESKGTYDYGIFVFTPRLCKTLAYDKFHRHTGTAYQNCSTRQRGAEASLTDHKMLEYVKMEYPCPDSSQTFDQLRKTCKDAAIYNKPIKITVVNVGTEFRYQEVTHLKYDEYGMMTERHTADGQTEVVEYTAAKSEPKDGDQRVIKCIKSYPSDWNTRPRADLHSYETTYFYKNIPQFFRHGFYYLVPQTVNYSSVHAESQRKLLRSTNYQYFTDKSDRASFGRVKESTTHSPATEHSMTGVFKYKNLGEKMRWLQIDTEMRGDGNIVRKSSVVMDPGSGLVGKQTDEDGTTMDFEYDSHGNLISETHTAADDKFPPIKMTYKHVDKPDEIRIDMYKPNGQLIRQQFDSEGRKTKTMLQEQKSGQLFMVEEMVYQANQSSHSRFSYYRPLGRLRDEKRKPDHVAYNSTVWFDELGREVRRTTPNGQQRVTIYDVVEDGLLTMTHFVSGTLDYSTEWVKYLPTSVEYDAGHCDVSNASALPIRYGQLRARRDPHSIAAVGGCNESTNLWTQRFRHDAFGRITEQWVQTKDRYKLFGRQFLGHDEAGRVVEELHEKDERTEFRLKLNYDELYNVVDKVSAEGDRPGEHSLLASSRRLNAFGKEDDREFTGIISVHNYFDKFGRLTKKRMPQATQTNLYDSFGRLSKAEAKQTQGGTAGVYRSETSWNWNFDNYGRLRSVETFSHTPHNPAVGGYGNGRKKLKKIFEYDFMTGKMSKETWTYELPGSRYMQNRTLTAEYEYDRLGRLIGEKNFLNHYTQAFYMRTGGSPTLNPRLIHVHNLNPDKNGRKFPFPIIFMKIFYNKWMLVRRLQVQDEQQGAGIVGHTVYTDFEYDEYQRVSSIDYKFGDERPGKWPLGSLRYAYDDFGQIVKKMTESTYETYTYDDLQRLTEYTCHETRPWDIRWVCPALAPEFLAKMNRPMYIRKQRYVFDRMNRIFKVFTEANDSSLLEEEHTFLKGANPVLRHINYEFVVPATDTEREIHRYDSKRFQYDGRGNVVRPRNIAYDAVDLPMGTGKTHIASPQPTTRFFDEMGSMVYKTCSDKKTEMVTVFRSGRPILEMMPSAEGNLTACTYLTVAGVTLGKICTGFKGQHYLTDSVGSVVGMVRHTFKPQYYSYEPYGVRTVHQDIEAPTKLKMPAQCDKTEPNIGFQGLWTEADGSLLTANGRLLMPEFRQFWQADPLSPFDVIGANAYSYGDNEPIGHGDTSGERRSGKAVINSLFRALGRVFSRGRTPFYRRTPRWFRQSAFRFDGRSPYSSRVSSVLASGRGSPGRVRMSMRGGGRMVRARHANSQDFDPPHMHNCASQVCLDVLRRNAPSSWVDVAAMESKTTVYRKPGFINFFLRRKFYSGMRQDDMRGFISEFSGGRLSTDMRLLHTNPARGMRTQISKEMVENVLQEEGKTSMYLVFSRQFSRNPIKRLFNKFSKGHTLLYESGGTITDSWGKQVQQYMTGFGDVAGPKYFYREYQAMIIRGGLS